MNRALLFCCCLLTCFSLCAQEKLEKERRIQVNEVPAAARSFLDSCLFQGKVKWYAEEELNGASVEAKIQEVGYRYSIEFDTLGQIEDVEIERDPNHLSSWVIDSMRAHLARTTLKYKIKRMQVQWTGDRQALIMLIRTSQTHLPHTIKYEVEIKVRDDEGRHMYEYLFTAGGEFIQRRRVIYRTSDHLDY